MRKKQTKPRSRCCTVCPIFDAENAETHVQLVATQLKGTGNANAVFGTTHAGLVVRCPLQGCPKTRVEGKGREERDRRLAGLEGRMWSRRNFVFTGDSAEDQLRYGSCIVAQFLGMQYLPLAMRLRDAAFGATAGRLALQERVATDAAILMADGTLLAGMPQEGVVCIEIKPKFGDTVRCDTVPGRYRRLKQSMSRYQLHQSLKLEQGLIDRRSAYDPLDLFSSDPNRMRKALEALMDSPQNNLALFLGGIRVPREVTARCLDQACEILGLDDNAHLASTLQGILAWEGILDRVLRMQTLCEHDVPAVEALLRQLIDADSLPGGCGEHDDTDGGLGKFLDRMANIDDCAALDLLADYCVATTAKDCSILISMASSKSKFPKPPTSSAFPNKDASRDMKQGMRPCELGSLGGISYRVTVVDLDRKSLRKLEGHKRLDDEILRANLHILHSIHS